MPLFLKSMASEAVLGHWDGFWGNNNNYMFYIDESAVLHFIPFDTDNALGTSLFVDDVGLRDPFVFGRQSTTPLLVSKIMAIDEYRIEYAGYIRTLVEQDDLLRQQYAVDWIANVHSLIEYHLDNVTGEHEVIADKPASWGNQSDYRLFDFSSGRSFYTTRQATVIDAIGLPIADAGPDVQLIIGETFTLDGSNSTDPNGDIVSFAWSNEQNGSASALSFSAAGTYTATLTVTDSDGYTASDEITITVVPAPVTDDMSGSSGGGGAISFILLLLIIARLGLLSKPSEA
jgi:hypothetical protein